jgi:Carboxypeptidase regulatory-like domain
MQLFQDGRAWKVAGWLTVCGLLFALTGCGGGGGVPGGAGGSVSGSSIRGRVVERASGTPIPDATVTVGSRSTRTGTDGRFALSASVGTVSISVSAANFHAGTFSSVVDEGQTTDVGDLGLTDIDSGPPPPPF